MSRKPRIKLAQFIDDQFKDIENLPQVVIPPSSSLPAEFPKIEPPIASEPIKTTSEIKEPIKPVAPESSMTGNQPPIPPQKPENHSSGSPSKKIFGMIIGVIAGIIILSLVGVLVCLAIRVWDPLWNPFRPSPEKVMGEMFLKMKDVKTAHSVIMADLSVRGGETAGSGKIILSVTSDSENDKENPKLSSDISLSIKNGVGDAVSLGDTKLEGQLRLIDSSYYFKINSFPGIEQISSMLQLDSSQVLKQWFKIDTKKIDELNGSQVSNSSGNEEMINKVKELFSDSKIYSVKQQLKDERMSGEDVYHYVVSLDKESFKKFISDLLKTSNQSLSDEESKMFSDSLNKIGDVNIGFWIGKKNFMLYKADFEKNINMREFDNSSGGIVSLKFGIELSKFNEPVSIEAPKNAKDLLEMLAPIFGASQTDAKIKSDMNQIKLLADNIYKSKKSYASVSCLDKDIKPLCDDVKKLIGNNNVTIYKSAKLYCVSISFNSKSYCIDNKGFSDWWAVCDKKTFNCKNLEKGIM